MEGREDAFAQLARSVRRKRKADPEPVLFMNDEIKTEIKTEELEEDMAFMLNGSDAMNSQPYSLNIQEEDLKLEQDLELEMLMQDHVGLLDPQYTFEEKEELHLKEEIKEELIYEDEAIDFPSTSKEIRASPVRKTPTRSTVKEEIREGDIKEEPGDYHEHVPSSSGLQTRLNTTDSSASEYPPETKTSPTQVVAKTEPIEEEVFTCGECGEEFPLSFLRDNHFQLNHIIRSRPSGYLNPLPSSAVMGRPSAPKIPLKDARDDPSWRGHNLADGCHYKHLDNSTIFKKLEEADTGSSYMDCDECGERFGSVREHRIHVLKEHKDCRLELLCKNRHCVKMRELNSHENTMTYTPAVRQLLEPILAPIRCLVCKHGFSSYFHLYKHYILTHSNNYYMKFACLGCDTAFETPHHLKNHLVRKAGEARKNSCYRNVGIKCWYKSDKNSIRIEKIKPKIKSRFRL